MNAVIALKDQQPIAKGRMRLVFEHPSEPGLLVKVIRPDVIDARWGSGAPWYKRQRRYRQYTSYVREMEEYIAGSAGRPEPYPFAQKITGFAQTDLGLGLVMEAVKGRDGHLAPTLVQLIAEHRFDEKIRADLETFIQAVVESDLVIADFNLNNMVYGHDARHGDHFVLIDGLGLSTILPLKLLSRRFNRMSKRGRVKQMRGKIERTLRSHQHPPLASS